MNAATQLTPARIAMRTVSGQEGSGDRVLRWALSLAAGSIFLAVIAISFMHATRPDRGLMDLGSFMHSGESYRQGLNSYAENRGVRPRPLFHSLNLNPPVSVYLFAPISRLDPNALRALFFGESLVMFGAIVGALALAFPEHRRPLSLLAVSSLAGLWYVLEYNQIYLPLVAAVTGAWFGMKRGHWLMAGILVGLVIAIKPQFGILPLVLFAAQHRKPAVTALATAALISLIPLLVDGPEIYWQWSDTVRAFGGYLWPGNASLMAVGGRLGQPAMGWALIGVMLASVLLWGWRTRPDVTTAANMGIIAVILTGPTSWPGYTLFLLPILFSHRWDWRVWTAMFLFSVPQWSVVSTAVSSDFLDVTVGNINVWGTLLVLAVVLFPARQPLRQAEDEQAPAPEAEAVFVPA